MTNPEIGESRLSSAGKQIVRSTTFVSMPSNEKRSAFENIPQQPTVNDGRENITFMTFIKSNKDFDGSKTKSLNAKSSQTINKNSNEIKNFDQDSNNNQECYLPDQKTIGENKLKDNDNKQRISKSKRSTDSKDGLETNRKTCLVTTV